MPRLRRTVESVQSLTESVRESITAVDSKPFLQPLKNPTHFKLIGAEKRLRGQFLDTALAKCTMSILGTELVAMKMEDK